METIKIIKKLCENKSKTYKKALIMKFLEDINFHNESNIISQTIKELNLLETMLILYNETRYTKKTFNYLIESYKIDDRYKKEFDKLMNNIGNFRVAIDPNNTNISILYTRFYEFVNASNDYRILSELSDYGLSEGEEKELIKFALKNEKEI